MAVLADCTPVASFEVIDDTLVFPQPVTVEPVYIEGAGGVRWPGIAGEWLVVDSPYALGVQYQYQILDETSGPVTTNAPMSDGEWISDEALAPGEDYRIRYRMIGAGENTFGPWSSWATISMGNDFVTRDTVNVGGVPAQTVLYNVNQLLLDVDDLIATYGDTESAAASAAAAEAAEDAAVAARNAALLYRDEAEDQAGFAAGYASNSQSFRNQAEGFATASQGSAVAAASSYQNTVIVGGNRHFSEGLTGWQQAGGPWQFATSFNGRSNVAWVPAGTLGELYSSKRFPVDTSRKYQVVASVYAGAGTGFARFYVGFREINAAGNIITQDPPQYLYSGDLGTTRAAGTGWIEIDSLSGSSPTGGAPVTGEGSGTWAIFSPGTKSVELLVFAYEQGGALIKGVDYVDIIDITERVAAATSASAAQSSAATASAQAAAAQSSAVLAANVNTTAINLNATFDNYPASTGAPAFWFAYGNETLSRVADVGGGYSLRIAAGAGATPAGVYMTTAPGTVIGNEWYVIECEVTLEAGTFSGAAFRADIWNGNFTTFYVTRAVPFTGADYRATTVGNGVVGQRYKYALLYRAPSALGNDGRMDIGLFAHHEAGGFGSAAAANQIQVHSAIIRRATSTEVQVGQASSGFTSLSARITDVSNVAASATSAVSTRTSTLEARGGGSNLLKRSQVFGNADEAYYTISTNYIPSFGFDIPGMPTGYAPVGESVIMLFGQPGGIYYSEVAGETIAVNPGDRLCLSCHIWGYRTAANVLLYFYDDANTYKGVLEIGGFEGGNYGSLGNWTRLHNFGTVPTGATKGLIYYRLGANPAATGTLYGLFLRPMVSVATSTQTLPPPWSGASIDSRVSTTEGAIVNLQGRNAAWLQQEVNAGSGANAFIRLYAETSPGVVTSDVSIGAREVHVFNQVGNTFLKVLSVIGGNAVLTGSLRVGANILMGSGEGWPVAYGQKDFLFTHGETKVFGVTFDNPPGYTFTASNLAPLGSGESYSISLDVTRTQATATIQIYTPAAPSNYTNIAASYAGGTSAPDYTVGVTSASRAEATSGTGYDLEIYTSWSTSYYASQTGEVWEYQEPVYGNVYVKIFALKGGVWVLQSTEIFSHQASVSGYMFQGWNALGSQYSEVRNVALGTGVQTIGLEYDSSDGNYGPHKGGSAQLTDASWQAPGASGGYRSATPNGEKVKFTMSPR